MDNKLKSNDFFLKLKISRTDIWTFKQTRQGLKNNVNF